MEKVLKWIGIALNVRTKVELVIMCKDLTVTRGCTECHYENLKERPS